MRILIVSVCLISLGEGDVGDRLKEAAVLRSIVSGNSVSAIREKLSHYHDDIFSSFNLNDETNVVFKGVPNEINDPLTFAIEYYSLFPNDDDCLVPLTIFWLNRPSWYSPTRDEVRHIRSCVSSLMMAFENSHVSLVASHLAPAVYSAKSELSMRDWGVVIADPQTAIDEQIQTERLFFSNVYIRRLITEAVETRVPSDSVDVDRLIRFKSGESKLIHSNDFLDHEGFRSHTLLIWHYLFINVSENHLRDLMVAILMKPETIISAYSVNSRRMTMYGRKDDWTQSVGSFLAGVWSQPKTPDCLSKGTPIDGSDKEKMYEYFGSNEHDAKQFYLCLLDAVMDGEIKISQDGDDFASRVTTLLYLHKISSDFLSNIAAEIAPP